MFKQSARNAICKFTQLCLRALCVGLVSLSAHATTGGDDDFEILGFDAVDNKIFFSIIDGDGSAFVDRVFYIDLDKSPSPIFAKSLYTSGNVEDCDLRCGHVLDKRLHRIKNRLAPLTSLTPATTAALSLSVSSEVTRTIGWYGDPDDPVLEHDVHYQVMSADGAHQLLGQGHAVYYRDEFKIHQAFSIPHRAHQIVVLEYLGKPYEFGYKKYDVVLLSPQP